MSKYYFLKDGNRQDEPLLVIEDAKIFWNNFSGVEKQKNPAGNRNFCVQLDIETADTLAKNGWNVKQTKDEEPIPYLPVAVSYRIPRLAPRIVEINSRGKMKVLDEDGVSDLDQVELVYIDMIINPSVYDRDNHKIKAYVKELYATKAAPAFGGKYEEDLDPNPFD